MNKTELLTKYLKQQITLNELQKQLGLNDTQCRYLQSEFNNYIGGEYATITDALTSIQLHLL